MLRGSEIVGEAAAAETPEQYTSQLQQALQQGPLGFHLAMDAQSSVWIPAGPRDISFQVAAAET